MAFNQTPNLRMAAPAAIRSTDWFGLDFERNCRLHQTANWTRVCKRCGEILLARGRKARSKLLSQVLPRPDDRQSVNTGLGRGITDYP
jgi:hypothetical protein